MSSVPCSSSKLGRMNSHSATAAARATHPSPPLILVVEDHEDSRFMLRTALNCAGYAVIEAAAADEAMKLAIAARPDLILMDNHLQDCDGPSLTRAIRAIDQGKSAIIFLSGDGRVDARLNALAAGADAYLLKPVGLDDLESIIAEQLGRPRASNNLGATSLVENGQEN